MFPGSLRIVVVWLAAYAAAAGAAPFGGEFDAVVRPILQQYCFQCHGPETHKGDVNLSVYADTAAVQKDAKTWRTVLQQLNERAMPPANKPQPTEQQRQMLAEWVDRTLKSIDLGSLPKDPGRVTIRRLNRAEYNNTVRDLLGVEGRPADRFPADGAGGAGFDNNADTLFIPPVLMEQYLRAAGEIVEEASERRLLVARPGKDLSALDAARQVIETHAKRAFRRPVEAAEVERFLRLFAQGQKRGDSFEASIKLAVRGLLVSPSFLFRVEKDREGNAPWAVGDWELASRMSYFVWSSMPDDELMKLAEEGKLSDPAVLEAQARRMLKDPRSKAIGENFGAQWLRLDELKTTAQPDRQRYREYTAGLRDAMYDEGVLFVDSVFRDDASLMTLLDADYTFVNNTLAKHYGIRGIDGGFKGQDMQRVKLKDRRRGGVLGLGGVHVVTSYPLRTSPVLRGQWVLSEVLGAPAPPPPPDAGDLPQDDVSSDGLSFRQKFEKHRSNPQCATCHVRLDPLGFGLENFDAIGRWRDAQNGQPVDAAGVLSTGEKFSGPEELKAVLAGTRKTDFTRNLAEKLLAYALGRGLEPFDQPAVQSILAAVEKDGYRSATLVVEIVRSYPFRYRRNNPIEVKKSTP